MTDINGFQLTGRVADNAKLSTTKNGTAALSFCLAVNRDRKVNEQWVQKGSFFYLTVYGKRATGLFKVLAKGTKIGVQGYLEQDAWTDAAGKKQYKTVFCVENLVLLGQPKNTSENESQIPENTVQPDEAFYSAETQSDGKSYEPQENPGNTEEHPENDVPDIW